MIIVNNLCDFHDLYTSLTVTFVMYFNGRNKDILFFFIYLFFHLKHATSFVYTFGSTVAKIFVT